MPAELATASVQEGLAVVDAHFAAGELEEGMDLIEALKPRHSEDSRMRAQALLGSRLIVEKLLPGRSLRMVPKLVGDRLQALAETEGSLRGIVAAIDGSLSVSQLGEVLQGLSTSELIGSLATMDERGLIEWAK
jgi:hypothetical protein